MTPAGLFMAMKKAHPQADEGAIIDMINRPEMLASFSIEEKALVAQAHYESAKSRAEAAKEAADAATLRAQAAKEAVDKKGTGPQTNFAKELQDAGMTPGTPEWDKAMRARIARETSPTSTMVNVNAGGQSKDTLEDRVGMARAGMPKTQIVSGYGKDADKKWGDISTLAIKQIMDENPKMSRGEAAKEFAQEQLGYKATGQALAQNTKDLAAIRPYARMLEQNGDILKDLASKIIKTNSPWANKSLNWLQTNAGDNPDVREFLAQMHFLQAEANRVINNPRLVGQLSYEAKKDIDAIINGSFSLESTKRVVDRIQNDAARRVTEMEKEHKKLRSGDDSSSDETQKGGKTATRPEKMSDADWAAYQAYAKSHGGQ